ncbi:MAG: ornithine carbamoyltransferase, partial [Stellaceae bacterium]
MTGPRHFLDLDRIDATQLRRILDLGADYKAGRRNGKPLAGKILAMLFERPSTRTRMSFEVAMKQLGGDVVVMDENTSQLGRGETLADTARVVSRYVDAIMIRAARATHLEELAANATVPVINGLTDESHPCQIVADVMTLEERLGPAKDKTVAWTGDGNNVAASWIHAAARFDFTLRLACPDELRPAQGVVD